MLLAVIYIAFVGLGVPDSLIGSAWPAIYRDFSVPEYSVSLITLTVSGCTVISSVLSTGIINRFGTYKVSAVSTVMTALALAGFSFAPNLEVMWLCAIPLGVGAGAIDAGLNNFVALHYSAKHMNYLHCFYGIGVSCSPYLMSIALTGREWRSGYLYAFVLQSAIAAIIVFSFPIWKEKTSEETGEEESPKTLSLKQLVAIVKLRTAWVIMFATNAIEYVCGVWGSYYLVEAKGISLASGAFALTLYYAGMALGRFFSGLIANKIPTWNRIYMGCGFLFFAILMLLIPGTSVISIAGLFMVGFGNGSIYPNFIHLTPYNFGKDISQAAMGSLIAMAYIGVMLAPPLFGLVNYLFKASSFPIFISTIYSIMIVSIFVFARQVRSEKII